MWIALAEHHIVLVMMVESGVRTKLHERFGSRICSKKAAGFGVLFLMSVYFLNKTFQYQDCKIPQFDFFVSYFILSPQ